MSPLTRRERAVAAVVAAEVAATVHVRTAPAAGDPPDRQRPVRPPATGTPPEPVQLPLPTGPDPAEKPAARLVGELVEAPLSALLPKTVAGFERIREAIARWEPAPCPPGWTP